MADPVTPSPIAPEVDASPSVAPEPSHTNGRPKPGAESGRDPYLGVLLLLIVVCVVGVELGLNLGRLNYLKPLLDVAVALGLLGGMLVGVLAARAARARPTLVLAPVPPPDAPADAPPSGRMAILLSRLRTGVRALPTRAAVWIREPIALRIIRVAVALLGVAAIVADVRYPVFARPMTSMNAAMIAGGCVLFAALAAVASRYMADLDAARLPEAPGLARATRTIAWMLLLAGVAAGIKFAGQDPRYAWISPVALVNAIHYVLITIVSVITVNLLLAGSPRRVATPRFPTDLFVFEALGARANMFASVLDSAERRLGIDLRSTWAVAVVRQSVEPLLVSLIVFGWISTSVTVVGTQEEALIERLGVPVAGAPLGSGLHFHLPWPIDRVYRIPTLRVQAITIGNETEPKSGPEDVLWSVSHVANEFTLLLGDGRDLITIDGVLQFRILDARAWRYNNGNPVDALRVLAYRAVMRNTVSLTLSDALSENVVLLTARMRDMVQAEADAMGLGVEVVSLTMSGMHPPVAVATAYEAVISAQIKGTTAVVSAQAFRNEALPSAEASVINANTAARAQGAQDLARAAGESWAFRTLLSQYRAAPTEYQFRRRLETLEQSLTGKKFTVLDARFTRDGGEVWIEP